MGGPLHSAYFLTTGDYFISHSYYTFSFWTVFLGILGVLNYIHMYNPGSRSDFEQTLSVFLKMTYKLSTFIRASIFQYTCTR